MTATLGAASLSLRTVVDALAVATRHPTASTDRITQLAFTGLGTGLVLGRSFARAIAAGLETVALVGSTAVELVPGALRVPIEDRVNDWLEQDRARGRSLAQAELLAEDLVASLVPRVVTAMLDQLDLTAIVRQRVDLDAVVRGVDLDAVTARLDLNAIAAKIDVEALIERLDLAGIAQTVIDEIDLPEVIRRSTGSVASETVRGVRMQSVEADRSIEGLVDRVLRRRHPRRLEAAGDKDADETREPGGDER